MNAFERHRRRMLEMEHALILGMIYRGCQQPRSYQFDEYLRNLERIMDDLSLLDKSVDEVRASNLAIVKALFAEYTDDHLRHMLILLRMSHRRFHPERALL